MQRNFEIYEQKVQTRQMKNASGGVSDVLSNFGSLPEIHGRMPNAQIYMMRGGSNIKSMANLIK
jgi:hypothetical protein